MYLDIFNKRSFQTIQYLPKVQLGNNNPIWKNNMHFAKEYFSDCFNLFMTLRINLVVHLHSNKIVEPKENKHIVGIAHILLLNGNAPLKY